MLFSCFYSDFIIPSLLDSVGTGIMFLGVPLSHSSVCQILLPWYPMNGLNNFDKTDRKYSLAQPYWWPD